MKEYLHALSSPFDSFLENHILSSTYYMICEETEEIGYYAIYHHELLTQFYIRQSFQMHSQMLFNQALEQHAIKSLFVPTCDELFISLSLDHEFIIERQAYFFQESQTDLNGSVVRKDEVFRPANLEDLQTIQHICGDFLNNYEESITSGQLFVYYRGPELLGIGIVEKSKMFENLGSIGMFTNEAFRQQGVGRTILIQLRKWCNQQGIKPISGCWYYNEASKRTLESAGMVTKTRLLNMKTTS